VASANGACARTRRTLLGERTQWMRRIQATLFHHGVSGTPEKLRTAEGRATRTDRSTITSPTARSRTQISPGIHGDQHADHHNHSPPTLTQAPVRISASGESSVRLLRGSESDGLDRAR
jgi:hypothetical protein